MARVRCDECGDEHECSAAQAVTVNGKKTKRKLSPALAAQNARRHEEAARRAEGGKTTAATTQEKKSIVRELLGF